MPPATQRTILSTGLRLTDTFGPFAGEEGGPVGGGGEAIAVGGAEGQEDGEAAFAEGGVGFEGETVLEFDLGFGFPSGVGDFQGVVPGSGEGGGTSSFSQLAWPFSRCRWKAAVRGPAWASLTRERPVKARARQVVMAASSKGANSSSWTVVWMRLTRAMNCLGRCLKIQRIFPVSLLPVAVLMRQAR